MPIFYHPTNAATGNMWDTWLYRHEGTTYLYYLAAHGEQWDNISLATSSDCVHWNELGPVLHKGDGVTWMGTGSTWAVPGAGKHPRFVMNFSEWKGPRQTIFVAESDDLLHWTRRDDCEFVQDERWYCSHGRWDCIWALERPGGGFYGYWTATPKPDTGGRFGFGESLDGVHWQALPPPAVHGVVEGEVGAIEKIGDRYYMMFGNYPNMTTLTADNPTGPFFAAGKNRVLLGGHTYFSRFFASPSGLLVNHHSTERGGRVHMGLLKRAHADAEGMLRLGWWEGNDVLKNERTAVEVSCAAVAGAPVRMLEALDPSGGLILEGELTLPPTQFAALRGLYIEYTQGEGLAILFDPHGRAEFCMTTPSGSTSTVEHRVDREMVFAAPARWRLVLEGSLLELYLEDLLIDCFSLPADATGHVGVIDGGCPGAVSVTTVWQ